MVDDITFVIQQRRALSSGTAEQDVWRTISEKVYKGIGGDEEMRPISRNRCEVWIRERKKLGSRSNQLVQWRVQDVTEHIQS